MDVSALISKRFLIRFLIGFILLMIFSIALFAKNTSGNNGFSPNLGKLIPFVALIIWGLLLLFEALYQLTLDNIQNCIVNVAVLIILASVLSIVMYINHYN